VRDTPSRGIPADDVGQLLAAFEYELRATGRLSFATSEAFRRDPRLVGFDACMRFLRFPLFATSPTTPPLARRHRVHVCRLMLLSLGAHTDVPRWTAFELEQLFEAAMMTPGGELADVVEAEFALLAEPAGLPSAQKMFIRALVGEAAGRHARGLPAEDLVWIAVRVADPIWPVTEAQGFLAQQALQDI
jgi:hypothetical protein